MQVEIKEIKMQEPVISQVLAMAEFQKWLDYRKTGIELVMCGDASDDGEADGKDEAAIIEAFMNGSIVLNEDMKLRYILTFPLLDDSGSVAVKELKLNPRMSAGQFSSCVSADVKKEPMKMFINMISVLSGELKGVVSKLESRDYSVLQKICSYFL